MDYIPNNHSLSTWITFENPVEIAKETEKAVLCNVYGIEKWIPKSQITYRDETVLSIKRWLFDKITEEAKEQSSKERK